jgi:hypothetical protein
METRKQQCCQRDNQGKVQAEKKLGEASPRQIVYKTLSPKKPSKKKKGLAEWLK